MKKSLNILRPAKEQLSISDTRTWNSLAKLLVADFGLPLDSFIYGLRLGYHNSTSDTAKPLPGHDFVGYIGPSNNGVPTTNTSRVLPNLKLNPTVLFLDPIQVESNTYFYLKAYLDTAVAAPSLVFQLQFEFYYSKDRYNPSIIEKLF